MQWSQPVARVWVTFEDILPEIEWIMMVVGKKMGVGIARDKGGKREKRRTKMYMKLHHLHIIKFSMTSAQRYLLTSQPTCSDVQPSSPVQTDTQMQPSTFSLSAKPSKNQPPVAD